MATQLLGSQALGLNHRQFHCMLSGRVTANSNISTAQALGSRCSHFASLRNQKTGTSRSARRQTARAALGTKQLTIDIEKPLGLKLKECKTEAGGLTVTDASGNAASAGIQKGDTVIYTSSYFGDELWPCDSLNFTRTALAKAPSPVCVVYVKGENASVNVRRLPKKAAPARFGKSLTPQQQELASHICLDCGYVYCQRKAFEEVASSYRCPQCQAPKKRFVEYDVASGKPKSSIGLLSGPLVPVLGGLAGILALFYLGLKI